MLSIALALFIVAVIAGVFGFAGHGAGTLNPGQVMFYVFIVLFLLSLLAELRPRRKS